MIKNLIDSLKKQYEIYDIDDMVFDKICDEAVKSVIADDSIDTEYQNYWQCRLYLDNYIMEEIQKGNEDYKMLLSLINNHIIKRYITLKKINIDFINTKYKEIEQNKRLERYCDELSDLVIDDLCKQYDFNSSLDKQYVKELNKKFNR